MSAFRVFALSMNFLLLPGTNKKLLSNLAIAHLPIEVVKLFYERKILGHYQDEALTTVSAAL
jgi:hypothetical protein